jgi:predicted nucleotidyltransferase
MVASASPALGGVIARAVSKHREVEAAYLFGSTATGRSRRDSDVDVAVLLSEGRSDGSLTLRLTLMAALGSALGRDDVEVVVLNDAPPLLAHRVLSKGRLVFERSPSARVRFQVRTAGRYLDLVPMFETHIRYQKRNVHKGRVIG